MNPCSVLLAKDIQGNTQKSDDNLQCPQNVEDPGWPILRNPIVDEQAEHVEQDVLEHHNVNKDLDAVIPKRVSHIRATGNMRED